MAQVKLSHLAETLIASEIVRLGATIKEKIRNGESIYNYTIGDFDSSQFPIPVKLKEEIKKAKNWVEKIIQAGNSWRYFTLIAWLMCRCSW